MGKDGRTFLLRSAATALLLLFGSTVDAAAQEARTVSGQVTDAGTGQPLSSAQVFVQGTEIGTITGDQGRFELEVPNRSVTLRVRLIGYRRTSVTVPQNTATVDIALEQDVLQMQQIVVSGRATTVQRQNLANAVATVSTEEIGNVPAASIEDVMYGRVAGASVQSNSGAPGGGNQVRLRGTTTIIGDHKPLYVVDGLIVNNSTIASGIHNITVSSSDPQRGGQQDGSANRIADLNPKDIESIEILKGASAAAIYGAKASNGVVIITTKDGRPGEPRFTIQASTGFPDLSNKIGLRKFDSQEEAVAAFGESARQYYEQGKFVDHEELIAGNNPVGYEFYGSVSGGYEGMQFFASAMAKDNGGVVTGTGAAKQSVRVNLSQPLGDRVTLDLHTGAFHTKTDRGFTNNDNRNISYWMTFPYTPSFVDLRAGEDGTYPDNPFSKSNPLQTAALGENIAETRRFLGSAELNATLIQGDTHRLRAVGRAGIDYYIHKNNVFTPPRLQFEPNDGLPGTTILGNAHNENTNVSANLVHEFFLGGQTGGPDVKLTTSGGFQLERRDMDNSSTVAKNLVAGQQNVNKGTTLETRETRLRVRDRGFFLQEEAMISERLYLNVGVRADQSSNNADPYELFFYPKGAVSYRFPELGGDPLDEIKLRLAYGETGNRPEYGQKFTELSVQNIDGIGTLAVGGATASDLRPERQREIEGGIDMRMFNERLALELTGYRQQVDNVLLERQLAPSTGFATSIFNGGQIEVWGFEAAARTAPIARDNLRWDINATFSMDRSEVTSLPVPPFQAQGFGFLFGTFFIKEGHSLTGMWGNTTTADGEVTTAQLGNSNPTFRAGLANNLELGRFDFRTVWDWQQGADVFNLTKLLFDLGKNHDDCDQMVDGQSLCAKRVSEWPTNTAVYMEDATFMKVRELSMSYDLPESFTSAIFGGVENASIKLSGRNLLTLTSYEGLDPEVSNFGSQAVGRNIDVAPYPPSRKFWLSATVSF